MSDEPKAKRARKKAIVPARRAELAQNSRHEEQTTVLEDPHTRLVRIEPARYVSRVLVLDKTQGIHDLQVNISAGIDGTLFVQVTDSLRSWPAPAPAPTYEAKVWCETCYLHAPPHRPWCHNQ